MGTHWIYYIIATTISSGQFLCKRTKYWIGKLGWIITLLCACSAVITVVWYVEWKLGKPNRADYIARTANAEQDPKEQIKLARLALDLDPDNAQARLTLAKSLAKIGSWDKAEQQFREYIRRHPEKEWCAYTFLGACRSLYGKEKDAINAAQRAVELHGHTASPHNAYGFAFFYNGRNDEAIEEFTKALCLPGDEIRNSRDAHAQALAMKGKILWTQSQENLHEALSLLDKALDQFLDLTLKAYYLAFRGEILSRVDRFDEALSCFEAAAGIKEIRPIDKAWALEWQASIWSKKGQYERSLELRTKAREVYPQRVGINNRLGSTYLKLGNRPKALECFVKEARMRNSFGEVRTALRELCSLGKQEEAIRLCRQALEASPSTQEHQKYKHLLGCLLGRGGDFEGAYEIFSGAIDNDPNSLDSWLGLSEVLAYNSKHKEAVAALEKALELSQDKEQRATLTAVLSMATALTGNLIKAESMSEQALTLNHNSAFAHFARAYIFVIKDQPEAAYRYLKNNLNEAQKDTSSTAKSFLLAFYACACAKYGEKEEAFKLFKSAIDIDPSNQFAKAMFADFSVRLSYVMSHERSDELIATAKEQVTDIPEIPFSGIMYIKYLVETTIAAKEEDWNVAAVKLSKAFDAYEKVMNNLPPHIRQREAMQEPLDEMQTLQKVINEKQHEKLKKLMRASSKKNHLSIPFLDWLFH